MNAREGALMTHLSSYSTDHSGSDSYKIEDFNVIKGCENSVTLHERDININLSRYARLNSGENDTIILSYKIVDPFGLELPKLAYLFVEGAEGLPKLLCSSFDIKEHACGNVTLKAV